MTKIGCAVGVLRTGPAAGKLGYLPALGIRCIEVQFGTDAEDAENGSFVDQTRAALSAAGLEVWSAHTPFGPEVDISSSNERIRERGLAAALRTARGCLDLGGRVIVLHCGEHHREENSRREALRRAPEYVARIVDACASIGVQVALENLPPHYVTCTAEELLSVAERFPRENVGVCLDTGHAHIGGNVAELVRAVADRIITTHIHDNDRSDDQHYVPGSGTIDWKSVGAELGCSPYFATPTGGQNGRGPLLFEVSGPGTHAEAIGRLPVAGAMIAQFMAV